MRRLAKRLGMGFLVARGNADVSLGLVTSFAVSNFHSKSLIPTDRLSRQQTRAQAVIVTAIIPLLVNRVSLSLLPYFSFERTQLSSSQYFLNNDLCSSLPEILSPEAPTKHSCRQAYILASILTGIVQLITLLFSPLVGLISASPILSRNSRNPQAVVLSISFLLGTLACIGFALLPNGDPRLKIVWVFAIGLGVAQAAGTVVSLALITKGRGDIVAKEGREVGGALSSAYSFCGGLGILLIGSTAGVLFDRWSTAPFLLLAGVNLVVVFFSTLLWIRSPHD